MLSKSILKYIQSVHLKKFRDRHNVFIAEGARLVTDLLVSGECKAQIICTTNDFFTEIASQLHFEPADIYRISNDELKKISLLHTPDKVFAVFFKKAEKEVILQHKVNLMLDGLRDPGNLGTVIRIADWFNVANIICSHDCVEQYNPKVVQSSMGSISRVNLVYTDLVTFLTANAGIDAYAATLSGKPMYSYNGIKEGLLLTGNEANGISGNLLTLVKDQITIPRFGGAESLNAAVATGIILSHLLK